MSKPRDDRGRRLALHPGLSTLSPEEAEGILRRRSCHSSPSHVREDDGDDKQPLSNSTALQYPFLYNSDPQWYPYVRNGKHQDRACKEGDKVVKNRVYERNERSTCREKLQKRYEGEAKVVVNGPPIRVDKHYQVPYSRELLRRHSTEMTENIPSLGEVANDGFIPSLHGYKTKFTLQYRIFNELGGDERSESSTSTGAPPKDHGVSPLDTKFNGSCTF